VKFLFLFILLINSSFFLWEYRKGAPEIYLPHRFEDNKPAQVGANKIVLVSELADTREERVVIAGLGSIGAVTEVAEVLVAGPRQPVLSPDNDEGGFAAQENQGFEEDDFVGPLPNPAGSSSETSGSADDNTGPRQPILSPDNDESGSVAQENQGFEEDDFVGPLYKIVEASELLLHKGTDFMGPLPNPAGSSFETSSSTDNKQGHSEPNSKIVLQQRPEPEAISQLVPPGQSKVDQTVVNIKEIPEEIKVPEPVRVCYLLQNSEDKSVMASQSGDYLLTFIDREQTYIRSYLVLTSVASSLKGAKLKEQGMRQQGLNDLWLFRSGEFKWRISLGLFRSKRKALRAQRTYAPRTTEVLTVVPNYKIKILAEVVTNIQEDNIADFEEQFSLYLDKSGECESVKP